MNLPGETEETVKPLMYGNDSNFVDAQYWNNSTIAGIYVYMLSVITMHNNIDYPYGLRSRPQYRFN